MHVVIRLQNHGCKNHPYWRIVVAPKKRNLKGRVIEHIGYWIPYERKLVQRSVILNKPRIKYWLAMGAQVTQRVHKFLSWIDLLPPPLIKYGSKTLYERPKRITPLNTYKQYNPIKSPLQKEFLDKIMAQEQRNELKRKILYEQGVLAELPPTTACLEKQWDELRSQLYQVEKDSKILDPIKREQLFGKLNSIAIQWDKENRLEQNLKPQIVTNKNLHQQMLQQQLDEQETQSFKDKMQWLQEFQPLTEGEVNEYLISYNDGNDERAYEQFRKIYQFSIDSGQAVTKALVDEFIRHDFDNIEPHDQVNHTDNLSVDDISEIEYIPLSKPIHPLPDFNEYNPEDYTDIRKQQEQIIKNKAFSIPNIHLEGDSTEYPADTKMSLILKNQSRGRATGIRKGYSIPRNTKNIKEQYAKSKSSKKSAKQD